MPLYEYLCSACGEVQIKLFSSSERPETIPCSKCPAEAKYAISSTNFTINGASFANGYAGDSNFKWLGGDGDKK